jgi:hypothetical protein
MNILSLVRSIWIGSILYVGALPHIAEATADVPIYINMIDSYAIDIGQSLVGNAALQRRNFSVSTSSCSKGPCASNTHIWIDMEYVARQYNASIYFYQGQNLITTRVVSSSSKAALTSKLSQIIPAMYSSGISTSHGLIQNESTPFVQPSDLKILSKPTLSTPDSEKGQKSKPTSKPKKVRKDKSTSSVSANKLTREQSPNTAIDFVPKPDLMNLYMSYSANDPFLKRRGVGVSYHRSISERMEWMVAGRSYLNLGDSDLTTLTKQIKDDNNVAPDISRLNTQIESGIGYTTRYIQGSTYRDTPLNMYLSFGASLGMSKTTDDGTVSGILDGSDNTCPDISTLNSNSEQALFCKTQIEWHPHTSIYTEATFPLENNRSLSLMVRQTTYIETVNSTMLEMKNLLMMEVGYGIQF